jgi:hypothetical protein
MTSPREESMSGIPDPGLETARSAEDTRDRSFGAAADRH